MRSDIIFGELTVYKLQRTDKLNKRSLACNSNFIMRTRKRPFMLVTHSTNSLRSDRSRTLIQRFRPLLSGAFQSKGSIKYK